MTRRGFTRRWRTVRLTNPAAGADWALRAPGGAWWRVVSLTARLVTDATVANRGVVFQADDQTSAWWMQPAASLVTASSTVDFALNTGASHEAITQGVVTEPLPHVGLLLGPGHRLRPVTGALQIADQWSAVVALVDETPSDQPFVGDMGQIDPADTGG